MSAMAAPPSLAFFITTMALALLFVHSHQQMNNPVQFSYAGATGPDKWGILSPNFSMCGKGKQQSPINIVTSQVVVNKKLKPLIRSYGTTNVTLVNNKFNVGVRYPPDHSGWLIVDGKTYKLVQMHWHAPSEHRINGKRFAAELHLVHVAEDISVSVIAILFHYGRPDPLLAKIQYELNELESEVRRRHKKDDDDDNRPAVVTFGPFHPTEVRKKSHKYYRYVGSFTTPPCTQNVIWHILGKFRSISTQQVEALRAPLDLRCKNNARPCQPINGRHVEMYDEDDDTITAPRTSSSRRRHDQSIN